MTGLAARAWCSRPEQQGGPCGWAVEGEPDHVELESRRHVGDGIKGGPKHATTTSQRPTS